MSKEMPIPKSSLACDRDQIKKQFKVEAMMNNMQPPNTARKIPFAI